ncbi:hypothetical protein B0H14DRAFT_2571132 [Mycena olivaceomarginata]|nr:hypothetical protein B0H14DRAFT_2571132 [Mycena olivaceomarginata]
MAKTRKSVTARGIAKYAAEAHRRSSAAHRRRLKEHDEDWQRQKERARASDQKYRLKHAEDLAQNSAYAVKASKWTGSRLFREYIAKYGEQAYMEHSVQEETARQEKATAIAQEVAADEEREKRQEALMNWTQEWEPTPARSRASQSRSIALDAVG